MLISQEWSTRSVRSTILVALILLLVTVHVVGQEGEDRHTATAQQVTEPITIDGDLAEWNTSSPIVLRDPSQLVRDGDYWAGPQDLSASVFVMWDEANLYIGADVTEDTPFRAAAEILPFDGQDGFEIYLSTNPAANPSRTAYESTDFRILLLVDNNYWDTAIDRTMVAEPKRFYSKGLGGGQNVLTGFVCAVKRTTLGFIYEAVIPWENFANDEIPLFVPSVGDRIGFNFLITDTPYPCPGTEYVPQIAWTGDDTLARDPGEWGILVFE